MYRSIVISGPIASGTSTTAKALAEKLNLKYESAGDFFRKYMLEKNIPLHDKAKIPDELDQEIDRKLADLADRGGIVVDAHYHGYFTRDMTHVLKVLLTCDYKTRIERALSRTHTHNETEEEIEEKRIEEARKQAEEALKMRHTLSEEEYATAAANLQKALIQLKIKRRHRRV